MVGARVGVTDYSFTALPHPILILLYGRDGEAGGEMLVVFSLSPIGTGDVDRGWDNTPFLISTESWLVVFCW